MGLFEKFVSASSTEHHDQVSDEMVLPNTIGSIPKLTNTQNIMINSQFRSLEDFIEGYNVLKTCLETSSMFKKLIGNYKQQEKDDKQLGL